MRGDSEIARGNGNIDEPTPEQYSDIEKSLELWRNEILEDKKRKSLQDEMEVDQGTGSMSAEGGTLDTPVEIEPDGRLSRSVGMVPDGPRSRTGESLEARETGEPDAPRGRTGNSPGAGLATSEPDAPRSRTGGMVPDGPRSRTGSPDAPRSRTGGMVPDGPRSRTGESLGARETGER